MPLEDPSTLDIATHLGDVLQAQRPALGDLRALHAEVRRIVGFLWQAHTEADADKAQRREVHRAWQQVDRGLATMAYLAEWAAEGKPVADHGADAKSAADALLADAQDAGLYPHPLDAIPRAAEAPLDVESDAATDPVDAALAEDCVAASLGGARRELAKADAAIAASRQITAPKRDVGFRLMSRERVAEIARMGGKACAAKRAAERAVA